MPGAQIPTSVTRLESMLGYQAVSLTNFDSSALSAIAAGSKVEIAGAFFTFNSNETINATSWTAITTGNTAYIALTPAGTAGSQTVTASYTATAPVWSTSKQGWYASAGSSTRIVAGLYKAEATSAKYKHMMEKQYIYFNTYETINLGTSLAPSTAALPKLCINQTNRLRYYGRNSGTFGARFIATPSTGTYIVSSFQAGSGVTDGNSYAASSFLISLVNVDILPASTPIGNLGSASSEYFYAEILYTRVS
jgi:hypothetical protein